jgi:diadenosine tetraphosphate (Ap4A) HIT family hydrolase
MTQGTTESIDCPFCEILRGDAPGDVIARDDERGFALIRSIHPESVIHWLAVPVEHIESTEVMENNDGKRFLELFEFAVAQAKANREERPELYRGFSIKMHFGSFETVPHAKLHVLAAE